MAVQGEQQFSVEVAAPVPVCFEVITTFERYPEWFSEISEANVLERYPDGLGKTVEYFMDLFLKRIRYVLEYRYRKPHHLEWHSVDGDIDSIEGSYDFEAIDKTHTKATCRQAVTVGFWVPGSIKKTIEKNALRQSVLAFQAAAEAHYKETQRRRTKRA